MQIRWYVFEEAGPYNWQRAKRTIGPYYDEVEYFEFWNGYETEEDAVEAITEYIKEGFSGTFFIQKGYGS